MTANFRHFDLKLLDPPFGSKLNTLILELEHLRREYIKGSTHPDIFSQLKNIFHLLESIGSARIEGNRTTIAEYIEKKINGGKTKEQSIIEIENNEKALRFIEDFIQSNKIDRSLTSEIHKIITANLLPPPGGEGSQTPGEYRNLNVSIKGSHHNPPDVSTVPSYMEELFDFINTPHSPQYNLLKVALAHHRFSWIHPFDNGNGRVVRILTYAMLLKYGFKVDTSGRILNPTAIFCADRDKYYEYLSIADNGDKKSLLIWCEYVLEGLKNELYKIDKLLDYTFLCSYILIPSLNYALERKLITPTEHKILHLAIQKQVIHAQDIRNIFPTKKHPSEISRLIRNLKDKKMLKQETSSCRKYVISFQNNYLIRGVIEMLGKENFLPIPIDK